MFSAQAQSYIPPTLSESIMPTYMDNAIAPKLYNTSSYSYERVSFNVATTGSPVYKDMNLFVYAWSSFNSGVGTGNGLTYIRVNSVTNVVEHKDFELIDPRKHYTEVGIIQGEDKKVYIITLWNGMCEIGGGDLRPGTFYDLYEWLPSSLNLVSEANYINSYFWDDFNASLGHRVSMDVDRLKRVVFCWEEDYKSVINKGGIFIKMMKVEGVPPFLVTQNVRLANYDSANHYPDVAFGQSGHKIRIAYRKHSTPPSLLYDLSIESANTSSFLSGLTFVPPSSPTSYGPPFLSFPLSGPFFLESSITNYIDDGSPAVLLKNDQISLDCPNNSTLDLYSVVVARDQYNITALVSHTSGLTAKPLTSGWGQRVYHPVVAYDNEGSLPNVTFIWYNEAINRYVGTILKYNSAYLPPLSVGKFLIVNNDDLSGVDYEPCRPTISRNTVNGQMFVAYPYNDHTPIQFEMRSKWVNSPTIPFVDKQDNINISNLPDIAVSPNPFSDKITVSISNYNNEPISWSLINVQGRTIESGDEDELTQLNNQLHNISNQMAQGVYYLQLKYNGTNEMIKIVKQ